MSDRSSERPLSTVPGAVLASLVLALCAQLALHAVEPRPTARAQDLTEPPAPVALGLMSMGEPVGLAQAPHPAQRGGRRDMGRLRQRVVGQAGIGLQQVQQAPVDGIQ